LCELDLQPVLGSSKCGCSFLYPRIQLGIAALEGGIGISQPGDYSRQDNPEASEQTQDHGPHVYLMSRGAKVQKTPKCSLMKNKVVQKGVQYPYHEPKNKGNCDYMMFGPHQRTASKSI
jgi:hypothetical protein